MNALTKLGMRRALAAIASALLVAACGGGGGSTSPPCRPGVLACPCAAGTTCQDGLTCDEGFCVPAGCLRGSEKCSCYADGTCDQLDGEPMTCGGNVCGRTSSAAPGGLGGSCGPDVPCGTYEGTALDCLSGRCELAGCPGGELGCPCGPYGECAGLEGQAARCADGRCMLGSCGAAGAGTVGCDCRAGGGCDSGLECALGVCRGGGVFALSIDDPQARSCDVLLQEKGARVLKVRFAASVRGTHLRRAPRVAVSFVGRADAPFGAQPVIIETEGGAAAGSQALEVVTVECADRLGSALAGSRARLE
jgi:hypothetical protein